MLVYGYECVVGTVPSKTRRPGNCYTSIYRKAKSRGAPEGITAAAAPVETNVREHGGREKSRYTENNPHRKLRVSGRQALQWCEEIGAEYFEGSAKEDRDVEKPFLRAAECGLQQVIH
ncbi:hypothetical protein D9C73_005510 [Collichthys lucidus]|uniref:Uncharacterized protein n=1 Tax=Collichthys lucidus TaxID=240159 RepID=A0A4U5UAT3_COLLU|nr:hypothetical protein D9C73_005510 [Collichthys lucidus]